MFSVEVIIKRQKLLKIQIIINSVVVYICINTLMAHHKRPLLRVIHPFPSILTFLFEISEVKDKYNILNVHFGEKYLLYIHSIFLFLIFNSILDTLIYLLNFVEFSFSFVHS